MSRSEHAQEVGARVRCLRKIYEKTIKDFADDFEIPQSRLNLYELGDRLMPTIVAVKIKRKTGATLDWLYDGDVEALPLELKLRVPPKRVFLSGSKLRLSDLDRDFIEKRMQTMKDAIQKTERELQEWLYPEPPKARSADDD